MSKRLVNAFVEVRGNDVDKALKILKKKMQREGVFGDIKSRKQYEKPSEKRNREAKETKRRWNKVRKKEERKFGESNKPYWGKRSPR